MKLLKNKKILAIFFLILILGSVLVVPLSANAWNVGYGEPNTYEAFLSELTISALQTKSGYTDALHKSFTITYSYWNTEEDSGLIAPAKADRQSYSEYRNTYTLGILNYGYSTDYLGNIHDMAITRYYNDYNVIKEYIADTFALVPNDRDHMAEISIFYDNVMPTTPWYNDNPSLSQPIDNFDDDGYLCAFVSITGFFKLYMYGDSATTVGTSLYERNYEPGLNYSNAIIGGGNIQLIAEDSTTEHTYDIVVAIPINQDRIESIKNQYGGYFFDIYHSEYGAFYEIYGPAYDNGYNAGVNNAVDTDFVNDLLGDHFTNLTHAIDSIVLIDEGGITISLWDIFITVVVILVFIAFLKIYLGG